MGLHKLWHRKLCHNDKILFKKQHYNNLDFILMKQPKAPMTSLRALFAYFKKIRIKSFLEGSR